MTAKPENRKVNAGVVVEVIKPECYNRSLFFCLCLSSESENYADERVLFNRDENFDVDVSTAFGSALLRKQSDRSQEHSKSGSDSNESEARW